MQRPKSLAAVRRRIGLRRRATSTSLGFALVGVALALSGCLSSGYDYVSHNNADKTSLFFKIPSKWKSYDYKQIIEAANGKLSNSQLSQIQGAQWFISFGSSSKFTAKDASAVGAKYPIGAAFSQQISDSSHDTFSYATLRSEVLGSDPAASGSTDTLLNYTEFTAPGGFRGSRMTVDIPQSDGKIVTFGQVAMVDAATNWTYAIGIGCDASCWGPNQGLINQILKSWTVKER